MSGELRQSFTAMGCDCELQIFAAAPAIAQAAAKAALAEVHRIETKFSRYRSTSAVARINAAAGMEPCVVDPESAGLIDYGVTCWQQSAGAFDLTSGVLRRAWNFHNGALPSPEQVAELMPLVGWHKVRWEPPTLFMPLAGMELDLGGIAKEYAADTAAAACLAAGADVCLINLGGDVRTTGPHPAGRPWSIGIRHPRLPEKTVARVMMSAGGLATSGDYERAVIHDGIRYCHILDARTGWPVTPPPSVTVIAPVCMVAGSLTTLAMLAGPEARVLLEAAGLPWLTLDETGQASGPLS